MEKSSKVSAKSLFKFLLCTVMILLCGNAFAEKTTKERMTEDEIREQFIACSKEYLGTPYVYAGESKRGLDCSGFVVVSAKDAGLGKVPHSSQQLYNTCKTFEGEPKPGDLIFFSENGSSISHVGIWLGDGQFIHAASAGRKTGVIITKLAETTLRNNLVGYRALITEDTVVYKKAPKKEKQKPVETEKVEEEEILHENSSEDTKIEDNRPVPQNLNLESDDNVNDRPKRSKSEKKESVIGKAILDNCEVSAGITFDWSFIKPTDIDFYMQGVSLEGGIKLDRWIVNPGLMMRVKINANGKDGFGGIVAPVCLSLSYGKFDLYGGIVAYIPNTKQDVLYGTSIKLEPQLWPGMFGATMNFDIFNIGNAKFTLYQDVNYIFVNPQCSKPTNQYLFSGGFNMSSGLKVSF